MRSYASRTLHVEALDVYMGSNGMNSFQRVFFVNEMLRNTNLYRKRRWSVNGRVFLSCSSTRQCEGQNCLASGNRRSLARFGGWNFHLQEINKTLNCHRLILLSTYVFKHTTSLPRSECLAHKQISHIINIWVLFK